MEAERREKVHMDQMQWQHAKWARMGGERSIANTTPKETDFAQTSIIPWRGSLMMISITKMTITLPSVPENAISDRAIAIGAVVSLEAGLIHEHEHAHSCR